MFTFIELKVFFPAKTALPGKTLTHMTNHLPGHVFAISLSLRNKKKLLKNAFTIEK